MAGRRPTESSAAALAAAHSRDIAHTTPEALSRVPRAWRRASSVPAGATLLAMERRGAIKSRRTLTNRLALIASQVPCFRGFLVSCYGHCVPALCTFGNRGRVEVRALSPAAAADRVVPLCRCNGLAVDDLGNLQL